MTTFWETQTLNKIQDEEAQRHNEQIRQRYLELQNKEAAQVAATIAAAESQEREARFAAPANPVATERAEQVNSLPLTEQQKELFTTDTFRRVISGAAQTQERVSGQSGNAEKRGSEVVSGNVQAQIKSVEKQSEAAVESYSLTNAAKAVIAAFAAFVVLLFTLIGINTRILNAKGAELAVLEAKKAELVEQSRALAERIENATSEETIAKWAAERGWSK